MKRIILCLFSAATALVSQAADFPVVPDRCYRLRGVFTSDRPCAVKFGIRRESKGVKTFQRFTRYEIADGTCAIETDYWLPPLDEAPALREGSVSVVVEQIRGGAKLESRDFSLTEIPYPAEPKPALRTDGTQTNGLANSSFELGLAPHGFQAQVSCEPGAAKPTVVIDGNTSVHGSKSLKIDNAVGCRRVDFITTMAGLPETAKRGVASLYLKADRPTRVAVHVQDYYHDLIRQKELETVQTAEFAVGTEWKRFEVAFDIAWPLFRRSMRIRVETAAVVWADALQIEPGEKATAYAPASPVEAALDLDEHVFVRDTSDEAKNVREARLSVANYTDRPRTVTCRTGFGDKALTLAPGASSVQMLPFRLSCFGVFEPGGEILSEGFRGTIVPVGYAVVGEPPAASGKGFCQGVNYCSNGIIYLSPTTPGKDWHADDVAFYNWDGKMSFEERFRQMRLAGNRTALLSAIWPRIETEKGRFTWTATDLLVDSARKAGMDVLLTTCTPQAHFSSGAKDRMAAWFGRRNAKPGKVSWQGTKTYLPDLRDWTDYHRALLTHYRGRVKYWECIGEPNGTMPDADAYVGYLKSVHALRNEIAPGSLLTGICTTGDFDSDTGRFIREVGERGGFRFFDVLSFHPYGAPIDVANWQGIDAEDQYGQIRRLADTYEKGKPLCQTEVFYLDDGRLRPMGGKRDAIGLNCDWPAGYLARRVALDLAYGSVESMSLSKPQYYRSVPGNRTAAILDRFPLYQNPSAQFVIGNAAMRILENATFVDKPAVPPEQNAFRFRTRDGRLVRLQWCRGHVYTRTIELKSNETAFDVYGNRMPERKIVLTHEPLYVFESQPRREVLLDGEAWNVPVPHTWNAEDGSDGLGVPPDARCNQSAMRSSYRRGPFTYVRTLPPKQSQSRRYFLEFDGASSKAIVRVNGREVGRHNGAFTSFCFEITEALLPSTNRLEVVVDNTYDPDELPVNADYTMQGGLYRSVRLLDCPMSCIDPRVPVRIEADCATGTAAAHYVLTTPTGDFRKTQIATYLGFERWSPDNPHVYRFELAEGEDRLSVPFGFRTAEFRDGHFFLNGEKLFLKGVNRHQDRAGKGWALSPADEEEDVRLMKEMGCTVVRTSHYPQSRHFLDLCDRYGLVVWSEMPLVDLVTPTETFRSNLLAVVTEAVGQQFNHPSICLWSAYNELYNFLTPPMSDGTAEPYVEDVVRLIRRLDRTRPTVCGSNQQKRKSINVITDEFAMNLYPGWYGPQNPYDGMVGQLKTVFAANGKTFAVSEYGGGASIEQHDDPLCRPENPSGRWHPEEYQAYLHWGNYRAIAEAPFVWGAFVWCMFDFAADCRQEGFRLGCNDKGLVTADRQVRKDAFYFYQANWRPDLPVLHLVGQRRRTTTADRTSVLAFSNRGEVALFVNGRKIGCQTPDAVQSVLWTDVPLELGLNSIRIESKGEVRVMRLIRGR